MVTTENLEYMEYRTLKENAYLPKIISLKFLIHTFQIHICSAYVCANTHTVRYPFLSLSPLSLLSVTSLPNPIFFFPHFLFFSLLFSFFSSLPHSPNPALSFCGARSLVLAGAMGFALLLF